MNFGWNWITERIALGGSFESQQDVIDLQHAGVTHVINCTELCDPLYAEDSLTVAWPNPRQPDDGKPRTAVWFANGVSFWERAGKDAKLYVHCHAGMNRSASMVYAILRRMGIKPADARHLIVTNRPLDVAGAWTDALLGLRYADEAEQWVLSA